MCWQPVQRNQALCWVWSSSTICTEVQIPDTQLLFQTCLLWLPLPAACVWLRQHMEHGTELTQPLISDVVPEVVPCSGCCPEAVLLVPCKLDWEIVEACEGPRFSKDLSAAHPPARRLLRPCSRKPLTSFQNACRVRLCWDPTRCHKIILNC